MKFIFHNKNLKSFTIDVVISSWKYYEWSERDKLVDLSWDISDSKHMVKISFKKHYDKEITNSPFTIKSTSGNFVIGATKTQDFTISFMTPQVGNFRAYAEGYPTTVTSDPSKAEVLPPLKIFLYAETIQPQLLSNAQKLKIMYPMTHPTNKPPPTQNIVLFNKSKATLAFTLQTDTYFLVTSYTLSSEKNKLPQSGQDLKLKSRLWSPQVRIFQEFLFLT